MIETELEIFNQKGKQKSTTEIKKSIIIRPLQKNTRTHLDSVIGLSKRLSYKDNTIVEEKIPKTLSPPKIRHEIAKSRFSRFGIGI